MPTTCYAIIIATLQLKAWVMAMQIGDLIRMKREEHGLTQEQLAELIGNWTSLYRNLFRTVSVQLSTKSTHDQVEGEK